MTDIDMERLEYFRDRYHALVVIDYKVADDNHTGSLLSLDDVIKRLNKVTVENEQLKEELGSFEQVSFTDLCNGSRTVLYMKKEKGDSE